MKQNSRVVQRERTRRQLLGIAARTIAERGTGGTSVQAVADLAGLTTGAVYHQFSGREALVRAASAYALAHQPPLDEAAAVADTVEELLVQTAVATLRLVDDLDAEGSVLLRVQLQLLLAAPHDPEARDAIMTFLASQRRSLIERVEDVAGRSGECFSLPLVELADAFFALVRGFLLLRLAGPELADGDLMVRAVRRMVASAVEGPA